MEGQPSTVRIAAVADIHCSKTSKGRIEPLLAHMAESADVLCLCGDLTDYGLREEAIILVGELAVVGKKPMVCVLGNHDYESGQVDEVRNILCDAGAVVLCGESYEVNGVGFAGAKGFGGGFGEYALEPWGETSLKAFVQEAVDEAMQLEKALSRLRTQHRIALLHYAPIVETVIGEPPEIFPFLGSSRLEEPLNRFPVAAVFHGHAHHGALEGRTKAGVPVYNVSVPAFKRRCPDENRFRLLELRVAEGEIAA